MSQVINFATTNKNHKHICSIFDNDSIWNNPEDQFDGVVTAAYPCHIHGIHTFAAYGQYEIHHKKDILHIRDHNNNEWHYTLQGKHKEGIIYLLAMYPIWLKYVLKYGLDDVLVNRMAKQSAIIKAASDKEWRLALKHERLVYNLYWLMDKSGRFICNDKGKTIMRMDLMPITQKMRHEMLNHWHVQEIFKIWDDRSTRIAQEIENTKH